MHRGKGRGSGGEGTDREKGQSGVGPEDSGQREARPWVGRTWWSLHPGEQGWVQAQTTPALLVTLAAGRTWGAVARGWTVHRPHNGLPARHLPDLRGRLSISQRQALRRPRAAGGGGLLVTGWSGWGYPSCESSSGETRPCCTRAGTELGAGRRSCPLPRPISAAEIPSPQVPEAQG